MPPPVPLAYAALAASTATTLRQFVSREVAFGRLPRRDYPARRGQQGSITDYRRRWGHQHPACRAQDRAARRSHVVPVQAIEAALQQTRSR